MSKEFEPDSICEYRAGERIAWCSANDGKGTPHTGVIHEVRWVADARHSDGFWQLGVWIDGESRQMKDGKPRLHYFPLIGAAALGISKAA